MAYETNHREDIESTTGSRDGMSDDDPINHTDVELARTYTDIEQPVQPSQPMTYLESG